MAVEVPARQSWGRRRCDDGWWEVYLVADESYVIARCPGADEAWTVSGLLNGGIQLSRPAKEGDGG